MIGNDTSRAPVTNRSFMTVGVLLGDGGDREGTVDERRQPADRTADRINSFAQLSLPFSDEGHYRPVGLGRPRPDTTSTVVSARTRLLHRICVIAPVGDAPPDLHDIREGER